MGKWGDRFEQGKAWKLEYCAAEPYLKHLSVNQSEKHFLYKNKESDGKALAVNANSKSEMAPEQGLEARVDRLTPLLRCWWRIATWVNILCEGAGGKTDCTGRPACSCNGTDAALTTYISYFSRNKETVFISLLKKQQSFEGYESDDQSFGLFLTTCCVIRKKGKLCVCPGREDRVAWSQDENGCQPCT